MSLGAKRCGGELRTEMFMSQSVSNRLKTSSTRSWFSCESSPYGFDSLAGST